MDKKDKSSVNSHENSYTTEVSQVSYGSDVKGVDYETDDNKGKKPRNRKVKSIKKEAPNTEHHDEKDEPRAKLVPSEIMKIVVDPNVPFVSACRRGVDKDNIYPPGIMGALRKFGHSRTALQWWQLLAFYTVFYVVLAAFFLVLLNFVFLTGMDGKPFRNLNNTQIIIYSPGMDFKPEISHELRFKSSNRMVSFEYSLSDEKSYINNVKELRTFVENYTKTNIFHDCTLNKEATCITGLGMWKDCCPLTHKGTLGWDTGEPCILLKLNRIYGWKPEGDIKVNCEMRYKLGHKRYDKVPTKLTDVFPDQFSGSCFPFCSKDKAPLHPIIFVKLRNITLDKKAQIYCEAHDPNIDIHKRDRQGSIRFEILITK